MDAEFIFSGILTVIGLLTHLDITDTCIHTNFNKNLFFIDLHFRSFICIIILESHAMLKKKKKKDCSKRKNYFVTLLMCQNGKYCLFTKIKKLVLFLSYSINCYNHFETSTHYEQREPMKVQATR